MWLTFFLLLLLLSHVRLSLSTTTVCIFYNESDPHQQNIPCDEKYSNLTKAFEDNCHPPGSITFLLQPNGVHELVSFSAEFSAVNSVSISSMPGYGTAVIECHSQSGLTFIDSKNINITNVNFTGCSLQHELMSDLQKIEVNVTLCFVNCSYINIDSVTIMNSTGSAIYSTFALGNNKITNSNFLNNQPYPRQLGGAIGIEHTTCPQGEPNCIYYTWYISNCHFVDNVADFDELDITEMNDPTTDLHHGRGGGLFIILRGVGGTMTIDRCYFEGNRALYGGGLFIFVESAIITSNQIVISNTQFVSNNANEGGGGGVSIFLKSKGNTITFDNCFFMNNIAKTGGGFSLYATRTQSDTNQLYLNDCKWNNNTAYTGSAVAMVAWRTISKGYLLQPQFTNCNFSINSITVIEKKITRQNPDQESIIGTVYLDSITVTFKGSSTFTNNNSTAIYAINAEVIFANMSKSLFYKNSGGNGGAVALIGSAAIIVGENSFINFTQNTATVHGGAIYAFITSQHHDLVSINCFVRYYQQSEKPSNWNASFYFDDNKALADNETIFATTLDYCAWKEDKNETKTYFCNDESIWQFEPDSTCRKEIATLPANIQTPLDGIKVIPGMTTTMNLNATDDTGKLVNSYTLTVTDSGSDAVKRKYISDNEITVLTKNLSSHVGVLTVQSAFPRSLDFQVQIKVEECPPGYSLDQKSKQCVCTAVVQFNDLVRCASNFTALIKKGYWIGKYGNNTVVGPCRFCEPKSKHIQGSFIVLPKSYDKLDEVLCGEEKSGTLCTRCKKKSKSYALTITGYGCHDCSKSSVKYAWAIFIVTQILPVVIFIVILLFTGLPLASGYLNGAIFFAQTITTSLDISGNGEVPLSNVTNASSVLIQVYDIMYNVWNLDFIEPVKYCLAPHMSMNLIFVAQYAVALFPLVFVLLIFLYHFIDEKTACCGRIKSWLCFCRFVPLTRCYERIRTVWNENIVRFGQFEYRKALKNTLASCILLAYTRCALNTSYILYPAPLLNASNHIVVTVSYFNATTKYGQSKEHLACVIIAVLVAILFLIPVPLILFFCRYKNTNRISYLNILLESFQSEFKGSIDTTDNDNGDNANGGHEDAGQFPHEVSSCPLALRVSQMRMYHYFLDDLRWVSSLYFTMRIAMTLAYIATETFIAQVLIQQVLSCLMISIIVILQPYKKKIHNQIDGCIFLLIIIINSITLYQYTLSISMENLSLLPSSKFAFIVQYILVYLPMMWIATHIMWKFVKLIQRIRSGRRQYQRMNRAVSDDDDR